MRVIHKQDIPRINELVILELPADSTIISAGEQTGVPVIWYEFDPGIGMPRIKHYVFVALTGRPFNVDHLDHVSTIQRHDGIVLHVYAAKETRVDPR